MTATFNQPLLTQRRLRIRDRLGAAAQRVTTGLRNAAGRALGALTGRRRASPAAGRTSNS